MSRRIAFEGIENFRDFGDYAAGDRRLRAGVLYRSGHPGRATDADLDRLAGLGVSLIVDLRRSPEREREPGRRWPGFAGSVIENDIAQVTLQEWTEFVLTSDPTPERVRNYMLDYYAKVMFEPRYLDLYSRYFRALAETDGAVLVHCAGGKDRTGILCALTHHLAGVDDEDIAADYLLTNDMDRIRARLPLVKQTTLEMFGKDVSDETLVAVMRAEAEYLQVALATMRDRHGSLEGYLDDALGLDSHARGGLRERLLA
jgi:protein tyrosine/serine phosphatase